MSTYKSTNHLHKTSLSILALIFICSFTLSAQPSFWFKKQSQIDSLQILFPGIEEVGNLIIGYIQFDTTKSDIHDLSPLASIKKIWGDLYVRNNPHLKNLHGLHHVESIQTVVHTQIVDNDSLESLQGLNSVKKVGSFFYIERNPRLQTLEGLESLEEAYNFAIGDNHSLQSLDGLVKLEVVTDRFDVYGNDIQSCNLPALKKTGFLRIANEPNLTSLQGLSSLDSVGVFSGFGTSSITLANNAVLATLDGLDNIILAPGAYIWIEGNASLLHLDALETIQEDSLREIYIGKNPVLESIYYPNVKIAGGLKIKENTALQSLEFPGLQKIKGYSFLDISGNNNLKHISMPALQNVGKFWGNYYGILIKNNGTLENLGVWGNNLVVEGILQIADNYSLKSLSGLEGLKSVGRDFKIIDNVALQTLCNFTQFDSIGLDLWIWGDSVLTTLQGLETLKYVGLRVSIYGDSLLQDVNALAGIDSIGWNAPLIDQWTYGGIGFSRCPLLKKIDFTGSNTQLYSENTFGFGNCHQLDSVTIPYIKDTRGFFIDDNTNLKYLSLPSIKKVRGNADYIYSRIRNHPLLTSLDGISTITKLEHPDDSLIIRNNPLLTDCGAICLMLDRGIPASRFKLGSNDFPCNSLNEIEMHICDTLTAVNSQPDPANNLPVLTMPNPTTGIFYLELPTGQEAATLHLFDMAGRNVFATQAGTALFDVRHLATGLYFVQVIDRQGNPYQGKLVKR